MSLTEKYVREGHPTIDELIAEQRVEFPRDPQDLLGDFSGQKRNPSTNS